MTRLRSTLCAVLALSFAAGTAVPLAAAPLPSPRIIHETAGASAEVTQVQHRERRHVRREVRRDVRRGYYRGHRGYRYKRPGYRYYNGYWYPAAAFIAGAIVGGAISNNRAERSSSAHVSWCYDRWRSYREYDNTYQPSNGPRRTCVSPYS